MSDTTNYESHVKILLDERNLALDRLERLFAIYKEHRTEVPDNVRNEMAYSLVSMINATTTFLTEAIDVDQPNS
jgi:hypothetical protein